MKHENPEVFQRARALFKVASRIGKDAVDSSRETTDRIWNRLTEGPDEATRRRKVLTLFGGGLLLTGVRWPTRYDAVGEGLVGLMLIGLGVWALRSSRKLHLHPLAEHGDHAHLHVHGSAAPDPAAGGPSW